MGFDLDAWEERAAIMEFDAGMSRFRAETMAAEQQGVARHDAIRIRDTEKARHHGAENARHGADGLSGVQPGSAQEKRPMSIGHVSAGWGAVALLALLEFGGGVV